MPQVQEDVDLEGVFAKARAISEGEVRADADAERSVALITPGRLIMAIPYPPASTVSAEMLADTRRRVPADPKLFIVAIADTDVVNAGALDVRSVGEKIPFLGFLLGMAFDGHTVVVFEGHPSGLLTGCKGADLLLVDGAMDSLMKAGWEQQVAKVMRTPKIILLGRDGVNQVFDGREPSGSPAPQKKRRWWWPFGT
jgi:hypothetical protein